jgi:phosphoribosylaminoimidazole-succinocarboxamide synthase
MSSPPFLSSQWPGRTPRRGKVRDVYDLGDRLLFIATDRISAFDWVLPSGIPDKGRVLTALSEFWFGFLGEPHHLLSTDLASLGLPPEMDLAALTGRAQIVRKTEVVPIECVARGYLVGSGWKEYRTSGTVCGIPLPQGLVEADRLPEPIFTPATKAESGHDENISFETMIAAVGRDLAEELKRRTLAIYVRAAEYAQSKGIVLADTKFEFGRLPSGEILLIDEVLTPDSSRFWPADQYAPGRSPPSFDKQFVRDWLETTTWDKNSPPPELPQEIVTRTRAKYIEAYERLAERPFAWK